MVGSFRKNSGVAVLLTNKKLTFKTCKTVVNLVKVDLRHSFGYNSLVPKSNCNFAVFTPGDLTVTNTSLNSNLVQRRRDNYWHALPHAKYGASSKLKWFFYKFKYHGKGLKVKKSTKSSTVDFNLGSSHISKLYFNLGGVSLLRTKKNTYTAVTHNFTNFFCSALVKTIRPYNVYTKRGVRVSRQTMFRRFGKVSQLSPKKR